MNNLYHYKHNPIVRKIFLTMLASTILMNLTTAIASFADTVIIGYFLDDSALSVVTYATPLYMIINTFGALFAVGGSIAMSVDSGKGDKKAANKAFSLSVELLTLIGTLLLTIGLVFTNLIPHWLGAGEDVFEMVRSYSTIVMVGAPIFMLNLGFAFFVRNDGRPTLSMVGMIVSIAIDMVLNIVFIGFMDMGVAGAAYSTVIGQFSGVLVSSSHFLSKKNTLKFRFTFSKDIIRIVKNGASTALHFVYQFVTILILNHFISDMGGTNGVVVYTVVFNLYTVSLSLFEGISQTIQPMVSLFFGEKSYKKIKDTLRLALMAIFIICGSVTLVLEFAPQTVVSLFGISDPSIASDSALAVRIFSTSMIIMTINVVIGYYLQSSEHTSIATLLVSMRCFVLFLTSAFLLGKLFSLNGIWAAYTLAEVLSFAVYIIATQAERAKLKKQGTDVNFLLLDKKAEESILCATYNCSKDNFDNFLKEVSAMSNNCTFCSNAVSDSVLQYLLGLKNCIKSKKKTYIEVEIIRADQKVIIRDNLNHTGLENTVKEITERTSQIDYNPVLGWNRLCIK